MKKIDQFQITELTISGFKSYQEPTTFHFGPLTTITGGNGKGKSSIADAIAFAITGLPYFGERGIDKLYNEASPDIAISLRFVDGDGTAHELTRARRRDVMTITYDGYDIRQLDLTDMFGERDVFLSILNPLYFIEELGSKGKNLLERYLPMISHEEVLSKLSDAIRVSLESEELTSPDIYLKKRREEIRNLEETIIYLTGQKDLISAQDKDRDSAAEELAQRLTSFQAELAALEEKRFAGMDIPAMQDKLVELSTHYDEMSRDGYGEANTRAQTVAALREKIARRQGEVYQSKFTQALAEAEAKVKELTAQYQREAQTYKAMVPGAVCPTCHRPITEENLSEVQAALKAAANAIMAAGREQQTIFQELQETEKKAQETFEQFKADDLQKWNVELAAIESQPVEDRDNPLINLRAEIQELTAELEYGHLTQEEYDRMKECKEEIRQCEAEQAAFQTVSAKAGTDYDGQIAQAKEQIEALKRKIVNVALYVSKRAELTFANLKMNKVAMSLYDVVKTTGEIKDTFKFTYDGRSYDRLSLSEKIRAGMEVAELMKRLTGRNYPVFVDNMESVDDLANVQPTGQVIMARCVRGADLSVQAAPQPTQQMPQAA